MNKSQESFVFPTDKDVECAQFEWIRSTSKKGAPSDVSYYHFRAMRHLHQIGKMSEENRSAFLSGRAKIRKLIDSLTLAERMASFDFACHVMLQEAGN